MQVQVKRRGNLYFYEETVHLRSAVQGSLRLYIVPMLFGSDVATGVRNTTTVNPYIK